MHLSYVVQNRAGGEGNGKRKSSGRQTKLKNYNININIITITINNLNNFNTSYVQAGGIRAQAKRVACCRLDVAGVDEVVQIVDN